MIQRNTDQKNADVEPKQNPNTNLNVDVSNELQSPPSSDGGGKVYSKEPIFNTGTTKTSAGGDSGTKNVCKGRLAESGFEGFDPRLNCVEDKDVTPVKDDKDATPVKDDKDDSVSERALVGPIVPVQSGLFKNTKVKGVSSMVKIIKKLSNSPGIQNLYYNSVVLFVDKDDVPGYRQIVLKNPSLYFTNWVYKDDTSFEKYMSTNYKRKLLIIFDYKKYTQFKKAITSSTNDKIHAIIVKGP